MKKKEEITSRKLTFGETMLCVVIAVGIVGGIAALTGFAMCFGFLK